MRALALSLALASAAALGQAAKTEEDPTPLFEGQREVRSLREARQLGLDRSRSALDLWSGSYWPTFQGSLAVREIRPRRRRRRDEPHEVRVGAWGEE
jgi:hypothetical protein